MASFVRGDRVTVIAGQHSGESGVVAWEGTTKYGYKLKVETDDGEEVWIKPGQASKGRDEDESDETPARGAQLPLPEAPISPLVHAGEVSRLTNERNVALETAREQRAFYERAKDTLAAAQGERDEARSKLEIERRAHEAATRALDDARAKVRAAGFDSLDAALAAAASRGPAGVDPKRVADFVAKAARDAVLAALSGAKPAGASTFTLPDDDGISKRVAGLEIDDAPAASPPGSLAASEDVQALHGPGAALAPETSKPAANVPPVTNPAVRIKASPLAEALAASRAARKAVRS